ncbi:MAG: AAA family ATPase [Pseudomonadota bacterium]
MNEATPLHPHARPDAPAKGDSGVVRPIMPAIATHTRRRGDEEREITEMLGALWRGKWFAAFTCISAALLGAYYVSYQVTPRYAAFSRLVLQERDQNIVDVESVIAGVSTEKASLNTELSVIRSRPLIERLVRDMGLIDDPEFNRHLQVPGPLPLIEARLRALLRLAPEPERPASDEAIFAATVSAVRSAIEVTNQRDSFIFRIQAITEDRQKSTEIVNRLAQIYLDDQIATKFAATEYAVDWLSQRVTELETELKDQEEAIDALSKSTTLMTQAQLEALKLRERGLQKDISAFDRTSRKAAARASTIAALFASGDYQSTVEATNDEVLADLLARARAGDSAARISFEARVSALLAEQERIIAQSERQIDTIRARNADLLSRIAGQEDERQRLAALLRDVDATRILYETFLTRLKETSIQIGLQRADSRILEEAAGGYQVEPNARQVIAIAAIVGAVLGLFIVFLRHRRRQGFITSEDLEELTGYHVLGQIPRMPIRRRQALIDYLHTKPTSAAAEAIRNIRTSILMSNVDNPPRVILSTSSVPGEGKTTLSIALAQNLSGLGKRVLLIEGDIRQRTFAAYFRTRAPGSLVQVVSGTLTIDEAVLVDATLGCDVLLGDKSSINAADLFASEKFRDFLSAAKSSYDYVIIDTPPALVVPDSRVIGEHVDAIVYSVQWAKTPHGQALDGLRQFTSLNLPLAGLVLAQVDPARMRKYGYGDRYGAYANYDRRYYAS